MERGRRIVVTLLLSSTAALLAFAGPGLGHADGADPGTAREGCTCHAAMPSGSVQVAMTPPEGFDEIVPGRTYEFLLQVQGGPTPIPMVSQNQGGFALEVDNGTLAPVDDSTQLVQSTLTHTAAGNDQRGWTVSWTAPADPQEGPTFYLAMNSVNGDGLNAGGLDQWNRVELSYEDLPVARNGTPPVNSTTPPPGGADETPGPAAAFAMFALLAAVALLARRARS